MSKTTYSNAPRGSRLLSRRHLLQLLEERLVRANKKAVSASSILFKKIGKYAAKRSAEDRVATDPPDVLAKTKTIGFHGSPSAKYVELDEYFHHCLFHLHDFLINLNWHEPNLNEMTKSDSDFAMEKLTLMSEFIRFQKNLDTLAVREANRSTYVSVKMPVGQSSYFVQTAKRLQTSDSKASSPLRKTLSHIGRKKRVRFVSSPGAQKSSSPSASKKLAPENSSKLALAARQDLEMDQRLSEVLLQDLRDNHSVYALDLLIFSLNLFIQKLSDRLVDWSEQQYENNSNSDRLVQLLCEKQKLNKTQLKPFIKRSKAYFDVHLAALDYLTEIKQTYLIKIIATTLISRDSERVQTNFKQPRLTCYLQRISQDVEGKIIIRLVRQVLRLILDLVHVEVNLDPLELERGHENVSNFIVYWLNSDQILLNESNKPAKACARAQPEPLAKGTTPSSCILTQLDSLSELMRALATSIVNRLRNPQQIRFFLETLGSGQDQAFGEISKKIEANNGGVAAKIRYLLCTHIKESLKASLTQLKWSAGGG